MIEELIHVSVFIQQPKIILCCDYRSLKTIGILICTLTGTHLCLPGLNDVDFTASRDSLSRSASKLF